MAAQSPLRAVLFLHGQAAVLLILCTFTVYCLLRNSAYFLNQVVMSALSKRSELGTTSAKSLVAVNGSGMIARVISFAVLAIPGLPSVLALLSLEGLGVVLNTTSSALLRAVPVRDVMERRSPAKIFALFSQAMKQRETRITFLLNVGGVMLLVLFNFAQAFLKNDAAFTSSMVLAFTVGLALAVIASGRFGRVFVDRFGSRPFLVITHAAIALLSLAWAFLPAHASPVIFFGLGFVIMFFLGLVTMLTGRLVLVLIPAGDKIAFSAILAFLAGLAALAAGLVGGWLADSRILDLPNSYGLTFLFMAFLALLNAVQSAFLVDKGSASLADATRVLLSLRNLRAFLSIDRLERSENEKEREGSFLDIEYSSTDLASAEIRRRLNLPLMREKEMLLRSLFTNPRPDLFPVLASEALDRNSWWRQSAIFALGAYPGEGTRALLYEILRDDFAYIRSVAAKSLARIGDEAAAEHARVLLSTGPREARTTLNALIALSIADRGGAWLSEIFTFADPAKGFRFQQSVLVIAGKRLGTEPSIEYYFYKENLSPGAGFSELLEEAREILRFYENETLLQGMAKAGDWAGIRSWCRDSLEDRGVSGPRAHLMSAVRGSGDAAATASDTLAILYFTYQLHRDGTYEWAPNGGLPE